MAEYIEREALLKKQYDASDLSEFGVTEMVVSVEDVENAPIADVVSSAVLEQVMWERDMALETLKEHGIGFCEKSDMVEARHGEWKMRGGVPRCSECDEKALEKDEGGTGGFSHEYVRVKSNYCPNCGAKMDGKGVQNE